MAIDNYPVPIKDTDWNIETCNRCGCLWDCEISGEPNRKSEWCKEVDRLPAACYCHDEWFTNRYLAGLDRIDAEAYETTLAWIEPKDVA